MIPAERKAAIEALPSMTDRRAVTEAQIAPWRGRLPDLLLELWQVQGLGTRFGGRSRLCLPEEYAQVVRLIMGGDRDLAGDCHAIAITAFGDLDLWSERYGLVLFSLRTANIQADWLIHPELRRDPDAELLEYVLNTNPDYLDAYDTENQPMFERALAHLGPLERNQIYAPMPPLLKERAYQMQNLRIVPAVDYLSIHADAYAYMLLDTVGGLRMVRKVGNKP